MSPAGDIERLVGRVFLVPWIENRRDASLYGIIACFSRRGVSPGDRGGMHRLREGCCFGANMYDMSMVS